MISKLSISGTVSFQDDCKNRWQTVYTSSLYGTMFSIFGKFNYDSDKTTLGLVELRIVNYKGIIDLGIKDVEFQVNRKRVEVYDEDNLLVPKIIRVISLKVILQGLASDHWKDCQVNTQLSKDDLADDIYLEIDRQLEPLADKSDRTSYGVYDTEYYYRDGIRSSHKFKGSYLDYKTGSKLNPTVNEQGELLDAKGNVILSKETNNVIDRSPGAVCPKGYSKIVF